MVSSAEIRETVTMWDVLDLLDIDYEPGAGGDAFIYAFDREENTPSVHVNDSVWYDFGSGEGGDVIKFLMAYQNIPFAMAMQILSRVDTVSITHREPAKRKPKEILDFRDRFERESVGPGEWLTEKMMTTHGITDTTLFYWDIRQGPGDAAWIPHWQTPAQLPMVKVRDYRADVRKNFKGSVATGLYRPLTGRTVDAWVLCEGESDCWAMSEMSSYEVYGLPTGAQRWESSWFYDLDLSRGYICLDNDAAGETATRRAVAQLGLMALKVPDEYNDVCEAHQAGVLFSDLEAL